MKNIVLLDAYSLGDSSLLEIQNLGNLIIHHTTNPEQTVERCKDFEIVITNKVKILKPEIDALPKLKLICVAATGVNNVDVQYANSKGITVKNVPAYSTQSVAEATFAMTLALLRQLPYYNDYVESKQYSNSGLCFHLEKEISEINGKCWGVIAMGNIGQKVAQIATAFGAKVQYYSTSGSNLNQPYRSVSFEELLSRSDIISIHAPLNEKTENLIAEKELNQMKSNAILVNVGRGGIVDEAALADALNQNKIRGAALDVFKNEPLDIESPLLSIDDKYKLITAPHSGWSSAEALKLMISIIAKNIAEYIENNN